MEEGNWNWGGKEWLMDPLSFAFVRLKGNSGQLSGVQSNPYYAGQTSRGDGNVQQGMMDPSTYNYMIQQQQYSTAVPEM